MTNLEYLEEFFRKHSLSGKITVEYASPEQNDDEMMDITFENGDTIGIEDVIFDIISELPADVYPQWMKSKRENDISLMEWIHSDNHYMPMNVDTSSIEKYHKEVEGLMDEIKDKMNTVFTLINDGSENEDDDE